MNGSGEETDCIPAGGDLTIQIMYRSEARLRNPAFGIIVNTVEGQRLCFLQTKWQYGLVEELPNSGIVSCGVPSLPLAPGAYSLSFYCSANGEQLDAVERARTIYVVDS
ncbi:MAG: Wzt carbohydrate-binding domain-containing protein, partial [Chloroflexi bacterium]|nr:Wzt carbohydrate-binding domain-containing protein [Chloroflexota bacterium]